MSPASRRRHPIETVFLDAGGVLVRPNWVRIAAVCASHGGVADPARLAVAELEVARELDDPDLIRRTDDEGRWDRFMCQIYERACATPLPQPALRELALIHARDNLWETIPDDVVPALEHLRRRGLRLVVVSNANGTVRAKLDRVGLGRFMHHVLDSFEEGVEKPDPRIFHIALERSGASPERTVHVGDFFHIDVEGARAAGLPAVLVDRAGLHADRACARVADLLELVDLLDRWPNVAG